jgi:hypothetical protein
VYIHNAGWQALPLGTEALVFWDHMSVVQRIVGEGEAISFQPLNYLHFTGKRLKPKVHR